MRKTITWIYNHMRTRMNKSIAVIGEGITEKYFIESLRGKSPFEITPRILDLKASSLRALEGHIQDAIDKGFDELYCLIDMDNKQEGTAKTNYLNLKNKYHDKVHGNKKKGIRCKVVFIESKAGLNYCFYYILFI